MEKHEYKERTLKRIRGYIAKWYDYTYDFEFIDLATETVTNALYDNDLEKAIENSYTYTEDKWTILRRYCFPTSADWVTAAQIWKYEITEIYNELKEKAPWED